MPTVRGWTVLAAGVALLAVGLAVGYRELAALGGAALLAVTLAAAWVGRPPRLLVDRTVEPDRVTRGEPCRMVVDIHAAGARPQLLTVADRVRGPWGERLLPVPPVRVRGGIPTRTGYDLPTERRGRLVIGPLRVSRRDPLGLCRAQRSIPSTAQLVVRPAWHQLRGLPVGASPSLDGFVDGALHGNIAFHALREYQPGDELRHVHWRTSARVGRLMVREHIDTALPRLVLLLDDRAESYPDDADAVEAAVESAASVLATAGQAELPVALRLASWRWGVERAGDLGGEVAAGLDLLAEVLPVAGVDLAAALHRLRRDGAGDTLVFVTGPGAELGPVAAEAEAYARVVVAVLGPAGEPPALPGGITTIAAATTADFAVRWGGMLR